MNGPLPLQDIDLPGAVSWWPPAPGWWLLGLLLVLLTGAVFWLRAMLRRPRLKRRAQAEIERLLNAASTHGNHREWLEQLSLTLRRIGISYLPREVSAGVTGKAWYQKLNALSKDGGLSEASVELLLAAPYQKKPHIDQQALEQLQNEIRNWAAALPRKRRDTRGEHV
jgi:lambda repressor-like predicted transcriptional regulator